MHKGISPRQEARSKGLTRYATGKPCAHGHIAERMVSTGACVTCLYAHVRKNTAEHPERVRETNRRYRVSHRDAVRARDRNWRARNPDVVKAMVKRERKKNSDNYRQRHAQWVKENKLRYNASRTKWRRQHPEVSKRYREKYPEKQNAKAAKRRSVLLRAIPPWITQGHIDAINATYREAKRRSNETGIQHHVDHVVPLRGASVCGLHVPWNLQVLSANENYKKNNRLTLTP